MGVTRIVRGCVRCQGGAPAWTPPDDRPGWYITESGGVSSVPCPTCGQVDMTWEEEYFLPDTE